MLRTAFAVVIVLLLLADPVSAGPPLAEQSYVNGFKEHWKGAFAKQSTIVMGVLLAGAVGIFVITRGKKLK